MLLPLLMALALPLPGPAPDGEALLRQMNAAHRDAWFNSMIFVQRTTWPAQPQRPEETWYETMVRPGHLRIDIERGGALVGGMIFRDDTLRQFAAGQLQGQPRPLVHHLLVLLHDIHIAPSADGAIAKLTGLGFDLATTHETSWNGSPVVVVGAAAGDTTSSQFWVDTERLVVVRVIQRGGGGAIADTHIGGFTSEGGGLVERELRFHTNGVLGMVEEYTWVRTEVTIDPSVFDPAHLEPPAWIAEYKAGMK